MRLLQECYTNNANDRRVRIEQDDAPFNPRIDYDNIGTIVADHPRYRLGDDRCMTMAREAVEWVTEQKDINIEDEYLDCPDHGQDESEINDCDRCDDDGDIENPYFLSTESVSDIATALEMLDPDEEYVFTLPLYLLDHSGISISTVPFGCSWDSGQVGFIFITRKAAKDNWSDSPRESAIKCMKAEVEEFDTYIRGDVYGYICERLMPCPEDWDVEEWAEHDCNWEEEEDPCWGFFGNDLIKSGLYGNLDIEYRQVIAESEGTTVEKL